MVKVKPVQNGRTTRMSFSHINEVIGMPNLIEIQKNSYNWFLEEGLHEVFHDIAAIEDYTGNLVLEFVDYRLDKNPKYSIKECKERDATYAAPLYVTARLFNKQTGEVKEQQNVSLSCCKRLEQNSGIENCSTRRNGSPWVISSTRLLCAVAIM